MSEVDLAAATRTLLELERIHGYKIDAILPDGSHRYWSTHCRHGNHELCKGCCKGCGARCVCGGCAHPKES